MDVSSIEKEFRLIYEEHYTPLCRAAFRILHDKESAREIVQDIFVGLWNKGNWHQIQSPKAYLYVAVYNKSLTFLNNRKRFTSDAALVHGSVNNEQKLEEEELKAIIVQGIDNLPGRCKEIFLLSREAEMTYAQIAGHLDLSVKTVERQMGIALQKLREYLDTHWSGDSRSFKSKIYIFFL